MPWQEVSVMSLREEFVMLALSEGVNFSQLCGRYDISTKTGYKWLDRYQSEGIAGLMDRSRRPHESPNRSTDELEQVVVSMRDHYHWGGRKINKRLKELGHDEAPAPSTITGILHRHGRIEASDSPAVYTRFEHAGPNELWQMDFKGHFGMADQQRCHPLTMLDDHSRFSLCLKACTNERTDTVQQSLMSTFKRYGVPEQMLVDNGAPWGQDETHQLTPLTVWMMRLGINVIHSRPYHPQTLGKDERFHRTLKAELLRFRTFRDVNHSQWHFDRWRHIYNTHRPHEALDLEVPAQRYRPSQRAYPESLPPIEYGPDDEVRKVQAKGELFYRGRVFRIAKALRGYPVAIRPTTTDGIKEVYFLKTKLTQIDLSQPYR